MDPKPVCFILAIPPEIRQIIWTYVVGNERLHILKDIASVARRLQRNEVKFFSEEDEPVPQQDGPVSPSKNPLNILFVNRQISAETEATFYGANTFFFGRDVRMQTWLARLANRQKSCVREIGFYCPWRTFESVTLPQTIESVHLSGFEIEQDAATGLKKIQIKMIDYLNQIVGMILRNGSKVREISILLHVKCWGGQLVAGDSDQGELVRQSLIYCRGKALEYIRSERSIDAGNKPYQWLAGKEGSAQWLHQPEAAGLEDSLRRALISLSENDKQVPTANQSSHVSSANNAKPLVDLVAEFEELSLSS